MFLLALIKNGNRFILGSLLLMQAANSFGAQTMAKSDDYLIILSRMEKQQAEALAGSGKAAMEIAGQLSKVMSFETEANKLYFWLQVAAENGSPQGQHAYAQALWKMGQKEPALRIRARYWAKKSADQGFQPGKALLQAWEKTDSANKTSH